MTAMPKLTFTMAAHPNPIVITLLPPLLNPFLDPGPPLGPDDFFLAVQLKTSELPPNITLEDFLVAADNMDYVAKGRETKNGVSNVA